MKLTEEELKEIVNGAAHGIQHASEGRGEWLFGNDDKTVNKGSIEVTVEGQINMIASTARDEDGEVIEDRKVRLTIIAEDLGPVSDV